MQTNRKYINRVYTKPDRPQYIKPISFNETLNLSALISQGYQKINEIIEAIPNNWPVLIDVYETHTSDQIRVFGSVFLDYVLINLDETLSLCLPSTTSGNYYVNLLNDRFRPVLEISNKFMEPNWTTLYILNVVNGKINGVVYNDIYTGMHSSDNNAHQELFNELREYIDTSVDRWFSMHYREFVVFDYDIDGGFVAIPDLTVIVPELSKYRFFDFELFDANTYYGEIRFDKKAFNLGPVTTYRTFYIDETNRMVEQQSRFTFNANYTSITPSFQWTARTSNLNTAPSVSETSTIGTTSTTSPFMVVSKITMRGYDW